jgi:hypothetical protein
MTLQAIACCAPRLPCGGWPGPVLRAAALSDPDDGVPDFAAGRKGKSLRLGSLFTWVRLLWHAQVGTQHIDAGLPVLLPVVSQSGHGVYAG